MILSNRKYATITLLLIATIATIYCMPDMVLSPGEILINIGGDAAKNYYTFLYHAQNGSGIWFEGMNYPYGEHIVFTDAQPLFAVLLSNMKWVNPLIIFHLLLATGFFLAIVYVYKILVRFQVHSLFALIFAPLITIMSPQIFKLEQHFSLAYICLLPAFFYYSIAWYQDTKRSSLLGLFLVSLLCSFIHLYFALMIVFWVVLYSGGYTLQVVSMKQRTSVKNLLPYWLASLSPVILLQIFIWLTDPHKDRPSYPYGARAHRTTFNELFTSYLSPIWQWVVKQTDVGRLGGGGEGYSYLGVTVILILSTSAIVYIIKSVKRKTLYINSNNGLGIWLFIASGMLVFCSGIIFVKCFVCLDYASFIKQFRAIGRFSWPFYNIVTIVAVVLLYESYKYLLIRNRFIARSIVILAALLWLIEAVPYAIYTRTLSAKGSEHYKEFYVGKSWDSELKKYGYNKDDFQSILQLPYVHIGTEKLGVNAGYGGRLVDGFSASLALNLPLMDVMMSRSSWGQAFKQVRISGGLFADQQVLKDCNEKPILLIHSLDYKPGYDELFIINNADSIGTANNYVLYALSPGSILNTIKENKVVIANILERIVAADTCIGCKGDWFVDHLDSGSSKEVLYGEGAARAIKGNTAIVFNKKINPEYDMQEYEFSAWVLISNKDYKIPRFRLKIFDSLDNKLADTYALTQESVDNNGYWLRTNKYIKLPLSGRRFEVELVNIVNPAYLALDEIMLRPADATVISKNSEKILINNHVFVP